MRINIVGIGKNVFRVSVIVLKCKLYNNVILLTGDIERLGVEYVLVLVEIFDKGDNAALIAEFVLFFGPLILNGDDDALVEKCKLAKPV